MNPLPTIGITPLDVILEVVLVATLAAALLRAFLSLGLRTALQIRWVQRWPHGKVALAFFMHRGTSESMFALDHRQICAQMGSVLDAVVADIASPDSGPAEGREAFTVVAGFAPSAVRHLANEASLGPPSSSSGLDCEVQ